MTYRLSAASRAKLVGVHPDLVRVVEAAIKTTAIDYRVTCGVRTLAEQTRLVAQGASQTMHSKHLVQPDGFSHAVDVVALPNGEVSWSLPCYQAIAMAFLRAATELGVAIQWGGTWRADTAPLAKFCDAVHFQLVTPP